MLRVLTVTKVRWKPSGSMTTRKDWRLVVLRELSRYGTSKKQKVSFHLIFQQHAKGSDIVKMQFNLHNIVFVVLYEKTPFNIMSL